jgi:hypothetical protein
MKKIAYTLKINKDGNQKNPIAVSMLWRDMMRNQQTIGKQQQKKKFMQLLDTNTP